MSFDKDESLEVRKTLLARDEAGGLLQAAPVNDNDRTIVDTQTERIEKAIGEPLFVETRAGTDLSAVGRHLLGMARQILADNDRHLRSSMTSRREGAVRIGISSMLLDFLVDHPAASLLADTTVTADICSRIVSAFDDDDLDVAMVMDVRDHRSTLGDDLVAEFDIEFGWMHAHSFVLEADSPIPLATWPPDQHIVLNSLAEAGCPYRVVFGGPDYSAKLTAVRSGRCLAVVPRHAIASPFVEADSDHLPAIPPKKILLAVRGNPEAERFKAIVAAMSSFRLSGARKARNH